MSIQLNNEEKISIINSKISFWQNMIEMETFDIEQLIKDNNESKINIAITHVEEMNSNISVLQQILSKLTN